MTKWYDKGKEHHVKSMEALGKLFGRRATIPDSMISDASNQRSFDSEPPIKPDGDSEMNSRSDND